MPVLFLAGDSTVHPGGPGGRLVGWGDVIGQFFDTSRIKIENDALAGRSSRSFIEEGRWGTLQGRLHKGDFVLMQFGHNDEESALNVQRGRFSLNGIGDETREVENPNTHQKTTVRTFGWYMKKMISEAQAVGAMPIVLSPVPRNSWENGRIKRGEANHGPWAQEVAKRMNVPFVDINELIAQIYDPIGPAKIKMMFFTTQDNTHTSAEGAKLSAACVVGGLMQLKDSPLNGYLLPDAAAKVKDIKDSAAKTAATLVVPTTESTPATRPG